MSTLGKDACFFLQVSVFVGLKKNLKAIISLDRSPGRRGNVFFTVNLGLVHLFPSDVSDLEFTIDCDP